MPQKIKKYWILQSLFTLIDPTDPHQIYEQEQTSKSNKKALSYFAHTTRNIHTGEAYISKIYTMV